MYFILLILLIILLIYTIYKQDVGSFACFSLLFFSIAVTLFYGVSPVLFAMNAPVHLALFIILLVWQFNYYSWRTITEYLRNPVVLSVLAVTVIMLLHNSISPYYHTYRSDVDEAQFHFFSRVLFPFLILPFIVPDKYTRGRMVNAIPFWAIIYAIVLLSTFTFSSDVFSDRMQLSDNTGGITGSISISRFSAIVIVVVFMRILSTGYKKKFENIYLIIEFILFILIMLIAGQRGTLIGLGLAFLALFLRKEWQRHSFFIAGLAFFFVLVAITFIDFGQFQIFQRFSQFEDIHSFERFYDYGKTWDIFKDNHFLWGLGSKGYFFRTGRAYPHNIILEHISDYGIAGLLCITILLVYCLKYAFTLIRFGMHVDELSIACCWIVLCFSAMVSSSMLTLFLFYTYSGLLALTYQNYHRHLTDERNS